ncbi:DnaJ family domain-containing protein [Streptomyces sp. NPDC054802]
MTERKPPGVSFESWVDKQIREATERGDFQDLPGFGRPLPSSDGTSGDTHDEMWWIKGKMRREGLGFLPPTLALRKEAEEALERAARAPSESVVRRIVGEINEKIAAAVRRPPPGPPLGLTPYDVEAVVEDWRRGRA